MNYGYALVFIACFMAIGYSIFTIRNIMRLSDGTNSMRAIAAAIQEGAQAYLARQYGTIAIVGIISMIGLWMFFPHPYIAIGFVIGAVLSSISGYTGMFISVRANVRTTQAAVQGLREAFSVAFRAGAVTGFLVTGLGLLGVVVYALYLKYHMLSLRHVMESLMGLSFGASLISIFARLGGGIFTKGADVGADLVGKVVQGLPEDDPRNPAVIADNVGDNVGDCAGMAADLFETYVVTLVAAMQMAFIGMHTLTPEMQWSLAMYPVMMSAVCLIGCVFGVYFVRLHHSIMGALYKGLLASMVLSLCGIIGGTMFLPEVIGFSKLSLIMSCVIGMLTTGLLVWITEYYTSSSYRPVRSIAASSVTGAGTNIIQGLAISMEACFLPVLVISTAMLLSYHYAGLFGIGLAAMTMLAHMGMIIAIDAYGPVTDNAGGIAEMAGLDASVRKVTDQLDAVGNTTKAITKGYSIGSAVLAALVLFAAYVHDVAHYTQAKTDLVFDLKNPFVVVGLLCGACVPYLFGALSMQAVGRAAMAVVEEVKRQFQEIKGIMEYHPDQKNNYGKPDYKKAVDLLTLASIKAMIIPSLLPIIFPVSIFFLGKFFYTTETALIMLGGSLLGFIVTGFFVAISMTSGGGAWDNAKKYIEVGHHGGKGSEAYKAAVIGDTVGDPYKDTAGPAINPLIKIANLVALLLLAAL